MNVFKISALFAIIILSFSACGKKDNQDPAGSIIGTWKANKMFEVIYENGKIVDSATTFLTAPHFLNITLKTNNNYEADSNVDNDEYHESGYYNVSGNQITMGLSAADPDKETHTFQLKGNSLTLSSSHTQTEDNIIYRYDLTIYLIKQ